MTTSSERVEEWIVLISDAIDGHDFPALNAFTSLLTHFREALAGAHAIRCTCDGATRDARCVELQGVAGSLEHPARRVYVIFDNAGMWEMGESVYQSREAAQHLVDEKNATAQYPGYRLHVEEYVVQG